jgi:hypothetical protein
MVFTASVGLYFVGLTLVLLAGFYRITAYDYYTTHVKSVAGFYRIGLRIA